MDSKKIIIILITSLSLFIALTALVITEHTPTQSFNDAFYAPIAELITPSLTTVSIVIGSLTHWYTYAPIILLLLALPKTRRDVGIPLAITLSASAILGPVILKNILAIERPVANQLIDPGGFGYPSGHSMNAVVFFIMCAIMIIRHSSKATVKIGFTFFAIASILLVGLSRIYLGVHTFTDVIGGYLIGTVVVCSSILIERRIKREQHHDRKT